MDKHLAAILRAIDPHDRAGNFVNERAIRNDALDDAARCAEAAGSPVIAGYIRAMKEPA